MNRRRITKQYYFARYLTADVVNQLVVFTPAERAAAGGYAAAVVLERRKAVSPAFRRRLVRQLARVPPG